MEDLLIKKALYEGVCIVPWREPALWDAGGVCGPYPDLWERGHEGQRGDGYLWEPVRDAQFHGGESGDWRTSNTDW